MTNQRSRITAAPFAGTMLVQLARACGVFVSDRKRSHAAMRSGMGGFV
jgi:hypothetical protein